MSPENISLPAPTSEPAQPVKEPRTENKVVSRRCKAIANQMRERIQKHWYDSFKVRELAQHLSFPSRRFTHAAAARNVLHVQPRLLICGSERVPNSGTSQL